MNPKDLVGAKKAPLGLVPPALEIGAAEAMANGAVKYGPFNWREAPVEYMTYLVAMKRHILALIDGQDYAEDTGIHHLHHIVAGGGILIDAKGIPGCLIDNRPPKGPAADMLRAQDHSAKPDSDRLVKPEVLQVAIDFLRLNPGRPLPEAWLVEPTVQVVSEEPLSPEQGRAAWVAWHEAGCPTGPLQVGTSGFLAEGDDPSDGFSTSDGFSILPEQFVKDVPEGYCPDCGQPILQHSHLITCPAYGS